MNIVFMSMDMLPSTLWARDLYDQMHIRSDFRKWFPRMCQYGFIEGRVMISDSIPRYFF